MTWMFGTTQRIRAQGAGIAFLDARHRVIGLWWLRNFDGKRGCVVNLLLK